jgi:hypothetical protein
MRHAIKNIILSASNPTLFELALKTSLVPKKAVSGTPTLTRSSTKTITDFEGIVRTCKAGEIGVVGARRVENKITSDTDNFSSSNWAITQAGSSTASKTPNYSVAPNGIQAACRFQANYGGSGYSNLVHAISPCSSTTTVISRALRLCIKSNTGSNAIISFGDGTVNTLITVTPNWAIYAVLNTGVSALPSFGIAAIAGTTANFDISIYQPQFEETTGQSNQNPSEYVLSTENSTGATGVKYFPYLNGNTVSSNVVTEAQGAAIPEATLKGGLIEGARTNIALWNRDLTNAALVKTTTTAAKTATGIDGSANAASTLTATGTDSTVLQTVTLASSVRVFQPYIKRVTGTGAVSITTDNGTTWTDVTAQLNSSTYTKVQITQTVTNPVFGFKIATSGDVIAVDYADNQGGAFASMPILTTTAAVTRAADVLSYPTAGNLNAASGGIYLEFTPEHAPIWTIFLFGSYVDSNNYTAILHDGTSYIFRKCIAGINYDAAIALAFTSGTKYKVAIGWGNSGLNIAIAGILGTANSNSLPAQLGTTIQLGADGNGAGQPFAEICNIKFFKKELKTSKLISLTS